MFSLHKSNTKGVGFNKIIRRVHKNWYFKDVTWVKNLKWAHHCFFKKICPKTKLSKKTHQICLWNIYLLSGRYRELRPQFTQPHSLLFLFNVAPHEKFKLPPTLPTSLSFVDIIKVFLHMIFTEIPPPPLFFLFSSFSSSSSSSSNHPNLVFQWLTRIEITNHPNVRSKAFYGCSKSCEWQKT